MEVIAQNALNRVETLAEKLGAAEAMLDSGYAELGYALLEVQKNLYWKDDHKSWGAYMQFIAEKYKMGTRQLYHKMSVVKELQGTVELADLTDMGIAKASVIADVHRATSNLPPDTIEVAKDSKNTAKDLKQYLHTTLNVPAEEPGEWFDMDFAFMVTPEEKATLQEAERITRELDPVIPNTWKTFQQKKEVALRWAQEILSTYATPDPDGDPPPIEVYEEEPLDGEPIDEEIS